jgi:hypothetical protein
MKPRDVATRSRELKDLRRLDPDGFLRKLHASRRRGARPSARVPPGVSVRRLHDDRRAVAAAARRSNSIHDAAVTDGGLTVDNRNRPWTGEDDRRLLD